jgi:hypothetical protein
MLGQSIGDRDNLFMDDRLDLQKGNSKGWAIILALALLFVAWGLFIFFTVGDKGPPSWNFGVVRDIPGESSYSTQRTMEGRGVSPEPQHILGKPSQAEGKMHKEKP